MAAYKSQAILRATRFRAPVEGQLGSIGAAITIPSGTLIGSGDTIRLFRVDPRKIQPVRLFVDINGNLDGHGTAGSRTLAGTLGYLKSSNRAGTNLSVNAAGSAATEDADYLLAAAAVPAIDPGTVDEFGTAGDGAILSNGGFHIYHGYGSAVVGLAVVTSDSEGYDANVMDVAITTTAASSTATTADVVIRLTMEYLGIATAPSAAPSYLYGD